MSNSAKIDAPLLSRILCQFAARPRSDRRDGIRYVLNRCHAKVVPRIFDGPAEFMATITEIGMPGFRIRTDVQLRAGQVVEIQLCMQEFQRYRFLGAVERVEIEGQGEFLSTVRVFEIDYFGAATPEP